jgi:hypothetical protein
VISRKHFKATVKEIDAGHVRALGLVPYVRGGDERGMEPALTQQVKQANKDNRVAKDRFTEIIAQHFKVAAAITGMRYTETRTNITYDARSESEIAASVIDDCSLENIKRLLWIMYYSPNNVFKSIYKINMGSYYEAQVMEDMCMMYDERGVGSGCVAMLGTKIHNEARCKITARLKRQGIAYTTELNDARKKEKKEKFPGVKENNCVFLISKPWTEQEVMGEQGEQGDITGLGAGGYLKVGDSAGRRLTCDGKQLTMSMLSLRQRASAVTNNGISGRGCTSCTCYSRVCVDQWGWTGSTTIHAVCC